MTMADKIVVLNHGEVQQVGTPTELYNSPANLFVAGFIGCPRMSLFSVTTDPLGPSSLSVSSPRLRSVTLLVQPAGHKNGDRVALSIRPHSLAPVTGGGQVNGTFSLVQLLVDGTIVAAETASGSSVLASVRGDLEATSGHELSLGFNPGKTQIFSMDGK